MKALTYIDPVINLVELTHIEKKTAKHIAQQFENCWLVRYLWSSRYVYGNCGKLIGIEFQKNNGRS